MICGATETPNATAQEQNRCVPIALIVIVNSSHVARGRGSLYPAATGATMESIDRHERIPLNAPGHPWAYLCFPRAEVQLGIERDEFPLITDISFSSSRAVSVLFGQRFVRLTPLAKTSLCQTLIDRPVIFYKVSKLPSSEWKLMKKRNNPHDFFFFLSRFLFSWPARPEENILSVRKFYG